MALDLNTLQYKIEVDASQAKAEARETQQALDDTTQSAQTLGNVSGKTEAQLRLLAGQLSVARLEAKQLSDSEKAAIDACQKLGDSIAETSRKTGIAADTIRVYTQNVRESAAQSSTFLDSIKQFATGAAILGAIKASADWADRIQELSVQTGFGITALQKFDNAAKQNGSSVEKLASAQGIFQNALETGSKKVSDAVKRLGLDLDGLKEMSPEDQMRTLAEAITNVKDQTEKVTVSTELFRGAGRGLIPTLEEIAKNYEKLPAASEESIKQTGSLSDMFVRAKDSVLRFVTEAISPLVEGLGYIGSGFDALWNSSGFVAIRKFLPSAREILYLPLAETINNAKLLFGDLEAPTVKAANGFDKLVTSAKTAATQGLPDVVRYVEKGGDVLAYAAIQEKELNEQLKRTQEEARLAAKTHGDLVVSLEKTQRAMGNLTGAQIAQIESGLKLHDNIADIAKSAHTTVDVVKLYESGLKDVERQQRATNAEVKAAEEFQHRYDMSLKSSIDQMHAFNAAQLKAAEEGAKRFDDQIKNEFDTIVSSNKAADDTLRQMTMSSETYEIDSIRRRAAERKLAITGDSQLAEQARQAIDREAETAVLAIQRQHDPLRLLFADIRDQVVNLGQTVNQNFAAMLTGTESFGQGFANIWEGLKQTALNILSDILAYYEKVFIVRMLTGAAGGGGGWTQALAGAALSSAGGGGGVGGGAGVSGVNLASIGVGGSGLSAAAIGTGTAYAGSSIAGGIVGYKVGRATGSAAKGALAGAGTGALYGSVVPGGGTAIGAAVGAIMGAWGAHKANEAARNEMVAIRDQIKEQFGNLDAARQAAQAVGVDLDKAFANIGRGVSGVKEFNAVIADFEKKFGDLDGALKHYGLTLDQVREMSKSAQDQMNDAAKTVGDYYTALTGAGVSPDATIKIIAGDLNSLIAQAIDTGAKLPPTLEPYLQKLNEMGLLTDSNRDKLLGLTTANTVDMDAMKKVADEYGLSLSDLGDKFNAAKLSADAQKVAADFKILQDGGADIGAVLGKMAPKFQDLVTRSQQLGTELPENLKDPIAYLIQMGMLTDQNGEKLTDLGQLKFGKSMADQFQPVTDAIHQLIDVLTGKSANSLPGALQDGISQMGEIARRSEIKIPVGYSYETFDAPNVPGAAHGGIVTGESVQYLAQGGRVLNFRPRGTDTVPAMLTPGEGVISRRGMAALSQINRGEVGSITIEKGAIVVNGADDPEATAEAIMRKLRDRKKYGRRVA